MKVKYLLYLLVAAGFSLGLQGCLPDAPEQDKQLAAEVQLIDDYLRASLADGVIYDQARGIRFQILEHGDGPVPKSTQSIEGDYSGSLFSSSGVFTPFGSGSVDDNISDVTPSGLGIGYSFLLEGSTARVFVPSKYGYGETGTTNVPANSTLVYTVTLNKVARSTAEQTRFEADTARIADYLDEVEGVQKKRSGIFFKETMPGLGVVPNPYDVVTMKYSLRILAENGPTDQIEGGTLTDQSVFSLIDGLKIGLQLLREGGKGTFYIPSYLAYGDRASKEIPANSIVIFDIEIVKVNRAQ